MDGRRLLKVLLTIAVAAVYGGAVAYMVTGVARRYAAEQARLKAARPSRGQNLANALLRAKAGRRGDRSSLVLSRSGQAAGRMLAGALAGAAAARGVTARLRRASDRS